MSEARQLDSEIREQQQQGARPFGPRLTTFRLLGVSTGSIMPTARGCLRKNVIRQFPCGVCIGRAEPMRREGVSDIASAYRLCKGGWAKDAALPLRANRCAEALVARAIHLRGFQNQVSDTHNPPWKGMMINRSWHDA